MFLEIVTPEKTLFSNEIKYPDSLAKTALIDLVDYIAVRKK